MHGLYKEIRMQNEWLRLLLGPGRLRSGGQNEWLRFLLGPGRVRSGLFIGRSE